MEKKKYLFNKIKTRGTLSFIACILLFLNETMEHMGQQKNRSPVDLAIFVDMLLDVYTVYDKIDKNDLVVEKNLMRSFYKKITGKDDLNLTFNEKVANIKEKIIKPKIKVDMFSEEDVLKIWKEGVEEGFSRIEYHFEKIRKNARKNKDLQKPFDEVIKALLLRIKELKEMYLSVSIHNKSTNYYEIYRESIEDLLKK